MDPYLIWVLVGLALLLLVRVLRWALDDPGKRGLAAAAPAEGGEPGARAGRPANDEEEPLEPPAAPDPEVLVQVLRGGQPGPCREAVRALVEIGDDAIPVLEAALEDDDPDLKFDVQRALRLIRGELP